MLRIYYRVKGKMCARSNGQWLKYSAVKRSRAFCDAVKCKSISMPQSNDQEPFVMQSSAKVSVCHIVHISHLQELQTIGLPSVLVGKSTQPDTVQLVNTVYRLLQLHRHSTKSIDELKARSVYMGFARKVIHLYQYYRCQSSYFCMDTM